jgi:hypothetical protein
MKPDLYTKVVLTVIAVMLTVIASHQLLTPVTVVKAQDAPSDLKFSAGPNGMFYLYDQAKARLYVYDSNGKQQKPIFLGY